MPQATIARLIILNMTKVVRHSWEAIRLEDTERLEPVFDGIIPSAPPLTCGHQRCSRSTYGQLLVLADQVVQRGR